MIKYTNAIKNGKLKATEIAVGESVTGTLKGFKVGKYGSIILLEVQGREVELFPAGNLKYIEQDNKAAVGAFTTITRVDSVTTKSGFTASRFDITQDNNAAVGAATANAVAATVSVKDKLEAIRSNRTN